MSDSILADLPDDSNRTPWDGPIEPIPTQWRQYSTRSRLEARWMVFFESMGLKFEYETQGWQMNERRYLPDFWLPQVQMWAEVKPTYLSIEEEVKIDLLAARFALHHPKACRGVLALVGPPECKIYTGRSRDAGDLTTAAYSLDIHRHRDVFMEGRLWTDDEPPVDSFSDRYQESVWRALGERFDR